MRHGGTPAPQVHFSHKYNGHYWQKTFPPPSYGIIISLLWKKSTIRIDKIITKFFCNFHRKFTLCLLPVTIPKTQKSLFSPKYGTFGLPRFPLTRYFVSLNEIIQIPSYALPFGITDVCSQIFRGYAGMQRVFRMVQLLLSSGVFSLCASVQQGGKYDNNLKYMHWIIRFVVTVRQLMQRYYGFPRSVCGLVVGMTVLYLCW